MISTSATTGIKRYVLAMGTGLALLIGGGMPTAAMALERGYMGALETLARGDQPRAARELIAFEISATPNASDDETDQLARREMMAARSLDSTSSESLIPIALLHEQAYLAHLAAGRLKLAIHSRQLAVDLIEFYLVASTHPESEPVASQILASIGGHLQQASVASVALALYERALELDSTNIAALMGLAGLYERQGSYERALPYLERLLATHPRHREAQLRTGINLVRLGRRPEGEALFEGLRQMSDEDWILSLAYQEMARLASIDGHRERARSLMLEAQQRLPTDASLAVQVAYLTDRTGGRDSSAELALALQKSSRDPQASPRALYSRISGQPLEQARRLAAASSEQRLALLEEALRPYLPQRKAAS